MNHYDIFNEIEKTNLEKYQKYENNTSDTGFPFHNYDLLTQHFKGKEQELDSLLVINTDYFDATNNIRFNWKPQKDNKQYIPKYDFLTGLKNVYDGTIPSKLCQKIRATYFKDDEYIGYNDDLNYIIQPYLSYLQFYDPNEEELTKSITNAIYRDDSIIKIIQSSQMLERLAQDELTKAEIASTAKALIMKQIELPSDEVLSVSDSVTDLDTLKTISKIYKKDEVTTGLDYLKSLLENGKIYKVNQSTFELEPILDIAAVENEPFKSPSMISEIPNQDLNLNNNEDYEEKFGFGLVPEKYRPVSLKKELGLKTKYDLLYTYDYYLKADDPIPLQHADPFFLGYASTLNKQQQLDFLNSLSENDPKREIILNIVEYSNWSSYLFINIQELKSMYNNCTMNDLHNEYKKLILPLLNENKFENELYRLKTATKSQRRENIEQLKKICKNSVSVDPNDVDMQNFFMLTDYNYIVTQEQSWNPEKEKLVHTEEYTMEIDSLTKKYAQQNYQQIR